MTGHPIRRAIAVLAAVTLTVTLTGSAIAAEPEVAAKRKVKCAGVVATKVGTAGADRIVGTAKRDVIAGLGGNDTIIGRGGNDLICGGSGNDRLFGGPGVDRLLGQTGRDRLVGGTNADRLFGGLHNDVLFGQAGPDVLGGGAGSDRLDGGTGTDRCNQNSGHGTMVRCELPLAIFAPPPSLSPPPPPTPPTPTPEPKTLALAYSNLDGVAGYQEGTADVVIAKLVDTDPDGIPSKGDTVVMNRYPLDIDATAFGTFRDTMLTVDSVSTKTTSVARVIDTNGADLRWVAASHGWEDWGGSVGTPSKWVYATDQLGVGEEDKVHAATGAPGDPDTYVAVDEGPGAGNDPFLEIVLDY